MRRGSILVLALAAPACRQGCGWAWLRDHPTIAASPASRGSLSLGAIDCPDGLARCAEGLVAVSRLAAIAQPCRGPESACSCPWEIIGSCERRCVADDVEVSAERGRALAQLCVPGPDAGPFFDPMTSRSPADSPLAARTPANALADAAPSLADRARPLLTTCDEQQLYRCSAGEVVDCAAHAVVASCVRGCFAEGAYIGDDAERVEREAAFAILCSR